MTEQLSPAAQVVLNAANNAYWLWDQMCPADANVIAAAALRAAVDEVAPLSYEDVWTDGRVLQYEKDDPVRNQLLAIAAELEQSN